MPRAASLDAARDFLGRRALFLDRGRDRDADLVDLGDHVGDVLDRRHGLVARGLNRRDLFGDFGGRLRGLAGQRFDFGGDDRKAAAGFAGARGLDGRVRAPAGWSARRCSGSASRRRRSSARRRRASGRYRRCGARSRPRGRRSRWIARPGGRSPRSRRSAPPVALATVCTLAEVCSEAAATTPAWRLVAAAVDDIDCAVSSITDDADDSPPTSSVTLASNARVSSSSTWARRILTSFSRLPSPRPGVPPRSCCP